MTHKKRSLIFYLRPVLSVAASIALVMLLVYAPIKKFYPSSKQYVSKQASKIDSVREPIDSGVPIDLFSYFSEGQFLSAVSDMQALEAEKISSDLLGDYITANYSDLEIIASN